MYWCHEHARLVCKCRVPRAPESHNTPDGYVTTFVVVWMQLHAHLDSKAAEEHLRRVHLPIGFGNISEDGKHLGFVSAADLHRLYWDYIRPAGHLRFPRFIYIYRLLMDERVSEDFYFPCRSARTWAFDPAMGPGTLPDNCK